MERCSLCKKKALCMFTCTCRMLFCGKCRVPEIHDCTFDYLAQHKEFLTERNPIVVPDKVEKI